MRLHFARYSLFVLKVTLIPNELTIYVIMIQRTLRLIMLTAVELPELWNCPNPHKIPITRGPIQLQCVATLVSVTTAERRAALPSGSSVCSQLISEVCSHFFDRLNKKPRIAFGRYWTLERFTVYIFNPYAGNGGGNLPTKWLLSILS